MLILKAVRNALKGQVFAAVNVRGPLHLRHTAQQCLGWINTNAK
jgi:acetoin utilization deacetylase AcuC-like enzyme